jgi:hypothetical protein
MIAREVYGRTPSKKREKLLLFLIFVSRAGTPLGIMPRT